MGRLEDACATPDRTIPCVFPWRGRLAADLLSHVPIPDEMQPVQRFRRFSSRSFSGKIEPGNQNNAGLAESGAAKGEAECFDATV
jgi:hypothetical protein